MTRLARTERAALCDLALQVGEDQPTLCGDWDVKDLVVHLLLREGSPAAVGIAVPPLAGVLERASERLRRRPLAELVERLRNGPPRLSPYALPGVDELVSSLELLVHHEDIRRAQPDWAPRALSEQTERQVWRALGTAGRLAARKAPVGVVAESTGAGAAHGATTVLRKGDPQVVVAGRPSEILLYVFGRTDQARVELRGDDDAVARLGRASLGL